MYMCMCMMSSANSGRSKMQLNPQRQRGVVTFVTALLVVTRLSGYAGALSLVPEPPHDNDGLAYARPDSWSVRFGIAALNTTMKQTSIVPLAIESLRPYEWGADYELHLVADKADYVHIVGPLVRGRDLAPNATSWSGNVSVAALFLGDVELHVELRRGAHAHAPTERARETLRVLILRNEDAWDTAFKVVVGVFVMVMYVSFGTVLDLNDLKRIVLRPIGPIIGFVGQFIVMPLLSYLIGYLVFSDMMELRLGLLFTGSTPAGGLSNILTVLLNGNINMSVTMTAISNLGAFGMMPLWIYTLGTLILKEGHFTIPYGTIAWLSFSLLLPLFVGVLIQKYLPKVSKQVAKHLQAVSLVLIVFIMVFAFLVNSYLFRLFTWRILLACSALPWLGYLIGWLMAKVCRQPPADALTIAIETGIQNTGIAIFMLKFALPQPQADITSAVPIANSVMTPLPMFAIYFGRLIWQYWTARRSDGKGNDETHGKEAVRETEAKTTATAVTQDKGHDNLAADV